MGWRYCAIHFPQEESVRVSKNGIVLAADFQAVPREFLIIYLSPESTCFSKNIQNCILFIL